MHDIDWKWCPRVATHEITRNFLISQARLQKARQTLKAYGQDLNDLLEAFSNLPFNDLIEADCGQSRSTLTDCTIARRNRGPVHCRILHASPKHGFPRDHPTTRQYRTAFLPMAHRSQAPPRSDQPGANGCKRKEPGPCSCHSPRPVDTR